jgi:hypothetical protein
MDEPDDLLLTATSAVAALAARPVYALTDVALCDAVVAVHGVVSMANAVLGLLVREAQGRDLPHADGAASAVACYATCCVSPPPTPAG